MTFLVFDVNETLLDLKSLNPLFRDLFGDEQVAKAWFTQLLQHSMVATLTDAYRDFGELAQDALEMVAKRHEVQLKPSDKTTIFDAMRSLRPHEDVVPALETLKSAGFKLAALTNSPYSLLETGLTHAGLRLYFEQALSVDEVKRFKPHPSVYQMAADKLGVDPSDMRMIAAHNWDTTGAIRAGCKAAFLARAGMVLGELDEKPDIIASTMTDLADKIIETDS